MSKKKYYVVEYSINSNFVANFKYDKYFIFYGKKDVFKIESSGIFSSITYKESGTIREPDVLPVILDFVNSDPKLKNSGIKSYTGIGNVREVYSTYNKNQAELFVEMRET